MQNISSLLKEIEFKKSELQTFADLISQVSGVVVAEKDMIISFVKGFKKLRVNTSGTKRTILAQKKNSIQEKLTHLGVTLVL